MKIIVLCLCLGFWGFCALGQEKYSVTRFLEQRPQQPDTVRAVLRGVYNLDKLIFTLQEDSVKLKVQLAGKQKEMMPALSAMDLRHGDTLTVVGVANSKKKLRAKDPQMVQAQILSLDHAVSHEDQPAYLFSLDKEPTFMGRNTSHFTQWVNSKLIYPEFSRSNLSQGKVKLRFIIDKDGELTDLAIVESSGDMSLDAEALRVVSSSPAWEPGMLNGKPVKVSFTFPVIFVLKSSSNKM